MKISLFAQAPYRYLPEDFEGWVYTVHNRYLLILAESGILGVTCLLLLYLAILRQALSGISQVTPDRRPVQIGIVAALVVIHWQMIWDIYDGRQANYIYWFLAAAAVTLPQVFAKESEDICEHGGRAGP